MKSFIFMHVYISRMKETVKTVEAVDKTVYKCNDCRSKFDDKSELKAFSNRNRQIHLCPSCREKLEPESVSLDSDFYSKEEFNDELRDYIRFFSFSTSIVLSILLGITILVDELLYLLFIVFTGLSPILLGYFIAADIKAELKREN